MAEHNLQGSWGENVATEYLIGKGYTIAERNWRFHHLEVDIIAFKGNRIIFVEVKTRRSDRVDPRIAINRQRISHLVNAANTYVLSHKIRHEVQFDVIFVIGSKDAFVPPKIEHVSDAFFAPTKSYR